MIRLQAQEMEADGLPVGLVEMKGQLKFPAKVRDWQSKAKRPKIKNWPKYEIEGACIFTGEIEIIDVDTKHWKEAGDFNSMFLEFIKCLPFYDKLVYYKTINGGLQFPYFCPNAGKNKKLAIRAGNKEALIETRGVGGLAVCPPTAGYEWLFGSWDDVPDLTDEERDEFIEACQDWNQDIDEEEHKLEIEDSRKYVENTGRPGDDWASKNDFITWIKGHGWAVDSVRDGCVFLRRPGKEKGCSATWNYKGLGRFFCWSTSVNIPQEKMLKPFAVKAYLEHEGDFKACAMELRHNGYGNDALALVEAAESCTNWGEVGQLLKEKGEQFARASMTDLSLGLLALGIKGVTEDKIKKLKKEIIKVEKVDWKDLLTIDDDGKTKGRIYNVDLILSNDPTYQNIFFWDDFGQRIIIRNPKTNALIDFDDTYMARLRVKLGRDYGDFKPDTIEAVVLTIAKNNHFHPLQDRIKGIEWDGRKRIDTWLSTYCGAQDTAANRVVGRKWLLSAIARLFRPGCKVDNILILEGAQGAKKSTILRLLSYDNFLDGTIDIRSKDGLMALFGKWIIEFSELEGMNGRTADQQKAFLSKQEDIIRKPYSRKEEVFKRTCVFAGTTNRKQYLEDESGHRRFWPVETGTANIDAITEDRDQIWAETYRAFLDGEKWWIDEEDEHSLLIRGEQGRRVNHDEMGDQILEYVKANVMSNGKACISMSDIWTDVFMGNIANLNRSKQMEMASTLRKLGMEKGEFTLMGVRHKGWIFQGGGE